MNRFLSVTETAAAGFLLLVGGLVATNVLLRNLTGLMLPDWYDGSRLLLGIAMLWGVAITTYRGTHINVDLLWECCGEANKRRLDGAAGVFVCLFFSAMAWMTWQKVADTGPQVTADLRWPLVPFYAAAALGASAAAVLALLRLVRLFTGAAWRDSGELCDGS